MPYISKSWSLTEFKDVLKNYKQCARARIKSAITSQTRVACQRPVAILCCYVTSLRVKHVRWFCFPQTLRPSRSYENMGADNVKTLLGYDQDAAREWPYGSDDDLPKIGPPFKVSSMAAAQYKQVKSDDIRAKPRCHMTKYVLHMDGCRHLGHVSLLSHDLP